MGRVFKFHNDVDTDQIIASQYLLFLITFFFSSIHDTLDLS